MTKPVVHVIGTGGSISSIGVDRLDLLNYTYGGRHYTIEEMIAHVPEIANIATVRSEQSANVGSGDLSPANWLQIAARINEICRTAPETAGFVVTHGTATLEETAYFLNLTVKTDKPVAVTGAMRPMTGLSNDADLNLLDAIRVAATPSAAGRGVLAVLNNQIQAARDVMKASTARVDTFESPELGVLGYSDADGQVVFYRQTVKRHTRDSEFDVASLDKLPRVDIAAAYAGADGTAVDAFVKAGAAGIVSAGLGSGSVPSAVMNALIAAAKSGVSVVIGSQSWRGRMMARRNFTERGFVVADNLTPKKARILLMLALTKTRDPVEIQRMFYAY